ncbi:MAG TPA: YdcF family protein [Chitinophagales bacterium]|nr:YdcF family protein [Chitinophagales bacterium]
MARKLLTGLAVLLLFVGLLYACRTPVLRWFATSLIVEDPLQKADVMFVLSGGGYDRGNEAAKIIQQGYVNKVVCTGGNPFVELKVFNIDTLESDMTVADLKRLNIPDSIITEIREGTSTKEEAEIILAYCTQNHIKKAMVLSSKLHTHRINEVFRKKLNHAGIDLIVRGAPSSRFNEMLWWQTEDGLIAVNNEWLKRVYYWVKY